MEAKKWSDIIDKNNGFVNLQGELYSFEFLEELFKQIEPLLKERKELGLLEMENRVQKLEQSQNEVDCFNHPENPPYSKEME
jgi:hypothetical protein